MSRSDSLAGIGQEFPRNGEKRQAPDFKIYKHRSG